MTGPCPDACWAPRLRAAAAPSPDWRRTVTSGPARPARSAVPSDDASSTPITSYPSPPSCRARAPRARPIVAAALYAGTMTLTLEIAQHAHPILDVAPLLEGRPVVGLRIRRRGRGPDERVAERGTKRLQAGGGVSVRPWIERRLLERGCLEGVELLALAAQQQL